MGNTAATAILQAANQGHKNRGHPTWPNATEGLTGRHTAVRLVRNAAQALL